MMSTLVGIRSGLSAVRWLVQPKEVGLVVWVDGRPDRGARIFLPPNTLSPNGSV